MLTSFVLLRTCFSYFTVRCLLSLLQEVGHCIFYLINEIIFCFYLLKIFKWLFLKILFCAYIKIICGLCSLILIFKTDLQRHLTMVSLFRDTARFDFCIFYWRALGSYVRHVNLHFHKVLFPAEFCLTDTVVPKVVKAMPLCFRGVCLVLLDTFVGSSGTCWLSLVGSRLFTTISVSLMTDTELKLWLKSVLEGCVFSSFIPLAELSRY